MVNKTRLTLGELCLMELHISKDYHFHLKCFCYMRNYEILQLKKKKKLDASFPMSPLFNGMTTNLIRSGTLVKPNPDFVVH